MWWSAGSGRSPTRRYAAACSTRPHLIAAIEAYLKAHNADPKPFVWTTTADDIPAKVRRGRVALNKVES
jgi:hypothetical protein